MPLRERRRRPAAHARHADRGECPKSNRTPPASRPRPRRRCSDVRLDARPGAHRAWLQCHHQRAVGQIPVAAGLRGLTHRLDLGMRQRIVPRLATVAPLYRSPCLARRAPRHRPARHPASRRALPAQSPRTSPRQVRPCAQFIEIALSKLADTKSEPPFSNTSTFVSASFESAIHEQPPIRHHADAVY